MTTSPHTAALDQQIDELMRLVRAQTKTFTDLVRTGGDTRMAERVLWDFMDRLYALRSRRYFSSNLDQANAFFLGVEGQPSF